MIGKFFGKNKKKEAQEQQAVNDIIQRQRQQQQPSARFMAHLKKDATEYKLSQQNAQNEQELNRRNENNNLLILSTQLPPAPTHKPSDKKR